MQAEVQRQLLQYVQRYEGEANALREQLRQLQGERDRLWASVQHEGSQGDRTGQQHGGSQGDRTFLQHGGSQGDRAFQQHGGSQGDRASMQHGGSQGDRASMQHGGSQGDRAFQQHGGSQGDRTGQQHGGSQGDRTFQQHGGSQGDRAFQQHGGSQGDRASMQHGGSQGDRAFQQHGGSQGDRVTPQEVTGDHRRGQQGVEGSDVPSEPREEERSSQSHPTQLDLLGVIAAGMKQLQEAQVRALDKKSGGGDQETVKPGTTTLPELRPPEPETSPVEVQDWLQLLQAPMADLSDNSYEWWAQVQALALKGYEQWSTATPLERLAMKQPYSKELEEGRFARLNSRAASMLLAALDSTVRADLVMRKSTQSATGILYRVLTLYQPGGENEKRLVLDQLQAPSACTDPTKAAKALRDWERWFRRAKDIGVTTPDATVLARALSNIMKAVLENHPDAAFRTSLVKNELKLDTKPTNASVVAFHRHLLAEAEALSTGTKARTSTTAASSTDTSRTTPPEKQPRLKELKAGAAAEPTQAPKAKATPSPSGPTSPKPCRWFAKSDSGCRKGAECPFEHSWGEVAKAGRCLLCSGVGHVKKDCPTRNKATQAPSSRQRTDGQPSTTSTAGAANKAMNAVPESTPVAPSTQPAAEPSPTSSPSSRRPPEEDHPEALKKIMDDASKMLKTLMANSSQTTSSSTSGSVPSYESIQKQLDELRLKAMKVEGGGTSGCSDKGVLLDSGSTHVLRPARDELEEENTKAVSVTLAGDEQKVLRQAPSGSILLAVDEKDRVQTIVPFGAMMDRLNCTLKWNKQGLVLVHPKHGRIKTRVRAGCPEMTDAGQAAEIIAELEMRKVEELKEKTKSLQHKLSAIRAIEVKKEDWRTNLAAYAQEGCVVDGLQVLFKCPVFQDLPEAVTATMVPNVEVNDKSGWEYLKELPLSRRLRKRLLRSRAWVLNLFSGKRHSADPLQELNGQVNLDTNTEVVMLNVDVLLNGGWSLMGPTYKALMWAAMSGRLKAVLGVPPAKTFGLRRQDDKADPSRPMRSPTQPYGVDDLHPVERHRVDLETSLVARQLLLYLVAHASSRGTGVSFCLGSPQITASAEAAKEATCLSETPLIKAFLEVTMPLGMKRCFFDKGTVGSPGRAATTFVTNLPFEAQDQLREPSSNNEADSKGGGSWTTSMRRSLARDLKEIGVASTRAWHRKEISPDLRKLSAEQAWRLHVERDHVPFRKDCEQCVMSLGSGRPHRRTKQKSAYVLSVDIGGPMRATSRDGHGYGYRYFLAASYTKPRFADQPDPAPHSPEELASDDYDFKNLDLEAVPAQEEEGEVDIGHGVGDVLGDPGEDPLQEGDLGELFDPFHEEEEGEPAVHKLKAEELWDDDELAEQQQEKDKKEGEEMDGNPEVPTDHLYFVKPLKTKKSKAVMQAIQEIVLQLKHENLPVVRIHSDRAHELRSPGLREWALDQGIMLTRTEGQSPQSNGTAERAVRYLKGKARLMLRSSGLNGSHWATAMITAAHHQREGRLRPETYEPLCPYGSRVAIKKKRYSDGGKHDLMPHWVKGTYLGPVWDVRNGSAVLEDENGRIMVTTNVRAKLHDPGRAGDAPEVELHPPARRRLRGKSKVDEHGVAVKAVRGAGNSSHRRELVEEIIELMAKDPVHKVTRTPAISQQDDNRRSTYATVGAYNHGGVFGVTKYTEEATALTRKVTDLLRMDFPGECFTSATIIQNTVMPTHRDLFNDFDSRNLISPLRVTPGAAVWEELKPGDKFQGCYSEMTVKEKKMPGQLHMLTGPVMINPRRWHSAVQGAEGPRLLVAGHTIGSWRKLNEEMSTRLEQLGFVLPEDPEDEASSEAILKSVQLTSPGFEDCSFLVEEDEELLNFENFDGIAEVEQDICRCAKAAAENLYTPNVEQLLSELEGELRVVHTVHPGEVEKNLQEWIPSMMDELKALEGMKAIKRVRGKEAKDFINTPGAVIVPGKGVYTVKPPSKPNTLFRRKTRIVGCGNFQRKSEEEINYSGGAAAEGVRLLVAEASRKAWWLCNGDVCNAFLRAPVPEGTLLAIKPPSVLVRAGLVAQDELWIALTAVYGFRSSPRWWSTYRTDMMKKAVTGLGLRFEQGVAEPNIWRVLDKAGNLCGLIAIYVDDYLVAAPKDVCQDVHNWFSSTWQTTEVQFATLETSLRFLGMEMRVVLNEAGDFDGYSLDQEGYIQEVLRHHEVGERQVSTIPAAKDWMSLDPSTFPETYDDRSLKEAQSLTGELAWLAQRTRPDLGFTVSVMGTLMSKDPERAAMIGRKALNYLNHTKEWKLLYKTNQQPSLVAYTDSSYAPDGGRSHGGAVVFWSGAPVAWRSGRQALITTSSAETELLAASEGTTLMASVDALLQDVGARATMRELRVDNSAAITLASEEGGSWRTRHLKVRAGALRQRIQEGWMQIAFCPGITQLADGLTKILPARRMNELMRSWGLGSLTEEGSADPQPPQQVRQLQAPAELPQQQDNTTSTTQQASLGNLGCCLQLLVLMNSLTRVRGYRVADDDTSPLAVDSSLELYGVILMLVICAIALWEMGRSCYRSHNEGVRLRSLHSDAKLSKKELRTLNAYLKRNPSELSPTEREEMVSLADQSGVDLTGILMRSQVRDREGLGKQMPENDSVPPPPPPPPDVTACAADEELLLRRRRARNRAGGTREDDASASFFFSRAEPTFPRTRDAWVQCELGGEIPKKVYMTPKGTCVHSSIRCSTLNCSSKFQERDVCQRCVKGQRQEVDVRGHHWPGSSG